MSRSSADIDPDGRTSSVLASHVITLSTGSKSGLQDALASGPKAAPDSEFRSIFRSILSEIPSVLERLLYLAAGVSPGTRETFYRQFAYLGCGTNEVKSAFRAAHQVVFGDWLRLALEQKLYELEEYAFREGWPVADLAQRLFEPMRLTHLVPIDALAPETKLFQADVQLLLTIVASKYKRPQS